MSISRRQLLLNGALLAASASSFSAAARNTVLNDMADVVIIGSGIAGLACAVSAKTHNPGTRVVVLEKNTTPFYSSTAFASGLFNISPPNARGKGSLYQELLDLGHGLNDRDLLSVYVDHSQTALKWLTDHGVQVAAKSNPAFTGRKTYLPKNGGGVRYLEALYVEACRLGIEFRFNAKALRLLKNDSKRICTVEYASALGLSRLQAKQAVVLATGGFLGSIEKIDQYCGAAKRLFTFSSPASQGEGLDMAIQIGAATCLLGKVAGYAYGVPLDADTRRGLIFRGDFLCARGAIAIDRTGERFVNEELNSPTVFGVMQEKGMSECYVLASRAQLDMFLREDFPYVIGWDRRRFTRDLTVDSSFGQRFESLAQMADKIGADLKTLTNTVRLFNQNIQQGSDPVFGRNLAHLSQLKAPWYLFACHTVSGVSLGGLKISPRMEVLNSQMHPIKGLYAIGEVTGGVHGDNFAGGSSLSSAATFGFLAGKFICNDNLA